MAVIVVFLLRNSGNLRYVYSTAALTLYGFLFYKVLMENDPARSLYRPDPLFEFIFALTYSLVFGFIFKPKRASRESGQKEPQ